MNGPIEFGLILALMTRGLAVTSYGKMRAVAQRAEELGFDSAWLCDHFLTLDPDSYVRAAGIDRTGHAGSPDGEAASTPLLECWTALSALSRDTGRLRLGTSVLCNSFRYPSIVAKMAATLDVISEGRLELGLGAGWYQKEYEAYGIPFPKASVRIAQLDEAMEVIRRVWTEPFPTFEGVHYSVKRAACDPPPLQKPHPPLWIGGEGDRVQRVAARAATGINVRWWSPERFVERQPFLDDACREYGRDPSTLRTSLTALLVVSRDPAVVEAQCRRFAATPDGGKIAGTPEECRSRILQYVAVGVRHFLFAVPDLASSETLELFGKEVLLAVRGQG